MSLSIMRKIGVGAAATAFVAATGAFVAAPAQADSVEGTAEHPQGEVVSELPLKIRELPTTDSNSPGAANPGQLLSLECQVHSQDVDGNDRWYLLADNHETDGWVAARYVQNLNEVPSCTEAQTPDMAEPTDD